MKKTLSIILAIAMLVSLVPSVFAADKEYEVKYNFDFGAAGYDSQTEIDSETLKSYGDTSASIDASASLTWASENTDMWVLDGHYRAQTGYPVLTGADVGTSTIKQPNALSWYAYGTRAWDDGKIMHNSVAAIRLKIDEVGTYLPKLTFYARNDLCMYEVYLAPYKKLIGNYQQRLKFANAALVNTVRSNISNYFIGNVDMYAETAGTKTVELDEIVVTEETKGDYVLFLYSNGLNETLAEKYEGKDGPAIYVNLFSFSLYTEKKEEVSIDSSFDYAEEEFVGGSATLRAFAVYGEGTESEEDIIATRAITLGEVVSVEAPKSVTKGDKTYNFLYWAKGATDKKQIISYNSSFTYKAYAEANNLIAVYKEKGAESTKKEYYNANGQLMDGDTLPSLPGYGKATGWKDAGNGVYVAEYAPLAKNIEITVNGEKESYAYGDKVTCIASVPEGKVFMYWTKNDEIVSTESTYTFSAWEKATVTAVYGDKAPTLGKTMRKIVLDTLPAGEYTAVMAEFIGFSDAVEKGIIFGGKKIPMLTDKSQFTLTNDTENTVTVTCYAIINDNGTLKEISDGSISVE